MGCVLSKFKKREPETISVSDLLRELSKFNKRTRYYLKRKNNYYRKKSKKSPSRCDDEKRRACAEESTAVRSTQEPPSEVGDAQPIVADTTKHHESYEEGCVCEESTTVPSLDKEPSQPTFAFIEEPCHAHPSLIQEPAKEISSIAPDTTEHNDADDVAFAVNDVVSSLPDFAIPSLVQTSLPGFDYADGFDVNQLFHPGDCVETVAAQNEINQEDWMSVLESLHVNKMYDPSEDYDMIREIGEGSFGHVYLARHKQIQEEFAIKKIPLGSSENQANLVDELEILRLSLHKNILFLTESYLYDHHVYIITEYIDGLTISTVCQMATFSETAIASITKECLEGLAYLHAMCYVHCDIKGSNILLSKDGKVKIVDFGLTIKTDSTINAGIRGTFLWRAPEIGSKLAYGNKVDIWSIGMVVIEMLQQHPPLFWIEDVNQLLDLSRTGYTDLQGHVRQMVSEELLDFLYRGALPVDPNRRLSARQLLHHPFMMRGDNCECVPGIVAWAMQQQLLQ